jgi:hypothetical protein
LIDGRMLGEGLVKFLNEFVSDAKAMRVRVHWQRCRAGR